MTQHEMIIAHLKSGKSLTVLEALQRYGIFALSQRCGELKRAPYNLDILAETVTLDNKKRIARYSLKKEWRMKNDSYMG